MLDTQTERVLRIAKSKPMVTAAEMASAGIHSQVLSRLVRQGHLERVARGQYRLPNQPITEHHALGIAARAVPHGVICLLSALGFHEIGTQLPADVWMAIDRRARRPALGYPPLHIVRFSGDALREGIEVHTIEGQDVRIYSVAKTVVDCFKYRNKIGLDVALEALRESWQDGRLSMDELDRYARVCRVHNVMRPYLEMLVA